MKNKIKNSKLKIFTAFSSAVFLFSLYAQAGIITDNLGGAPGENFTVGKLLNLLDGVACWFIRLAIIAAGIMIVFYGILFLTSRGNPQVMATAKKALSWAIVGILVIMAVFTIILSVAAFIGVDYHPIDRLINC